MQHPFLCYISILLLGFLSVLLLTKYQWLYKVNKMNTPIVGFDIMKLSRDQVGNQPSQTLIDNILTIAKDNFPGTTYISISTPEDSNADFIAHGSTPSPLPVEQFINMQIDEIHAHGFNVNIRSFPASLQNAYGFPVVQKTSDEWVAYNKAFLETHASHLKNGDMISFWYELDWWQRDFGVSINDTGNLITDTNTFIVKNAQMVRAFAQNHGLTLYTRTAYSNIPATYTPDAVAQAQGAVVADVYGSVSKVNDQTQLITEMKTYIAAIRSRYGSTMAFQIQEWADIRNSTPIGSIQQTDPSLTANMADQVFFPEVKKGTFEIFFWDLFDTRKEGLLTITGDTATLRQPGILLSAVFKKWFGTSTPIPTPTPSTVVPAFKLSKTAKITYDGKGNLTITAQ